MEISCPNCKSTYELSDLSSEEEVTQCVCEECKSNLVLVVEQKKSGFGFSKKSSSTASTSSTRLKVSPRQASLTLAAVIIMCTANYLVIGGFIYGASQAIPENLEVEKSLTSLVPDEPQEIEPSTTVAAPLTKENIQGMLQEIDQAVNDQDVEQVMAYMNTTMKLTGSVEYPQNPQPQLFMMTRSQYEKNLQQTYEMAQDYEFSRTIVDITIEPDAQEAEVTSQTLESLTISGNTTLVRSKETMKMDIRGGRPLVNHIQVIGKMEHS